MSTFRVLYILFQILYFIILAIVLWFLLYYTGVPSWVWIFFGIAILLAVISLIIRELSIKSAVKPSGKIVSNEGFNGWKTLYIIMQIMAFILVIIGIIFVIQYSTIAWWVWLILGAAILLNILGSIFAALMPGASILAFIFYIIAFVTFVIGAVFFVIYADAPWWVWLMLGVALLFAIMASIFESMSERPHNIVTGETKCVTTETGVICNTVVKPVETSVNLLPGSNIPEQVIYA